MMILFVQMYAERTPTKAAGTIAGYVLRCSFRLSYRSRRRSSDPYHNLWLDDSSNPFAPVYISLCHLSIGKIPKI
jgi:hypothetical protein